MIVRVPPTRSTHQSTLGNRASCFSYDAGHALLSPTINSSEAATAAVTTRKFWPTVSMDFPNRDQAPICWARSTMLSDTRSKSSGFALSGTARLPPPNSFGR